MKSVSTFPDFKTLDAYRRATPEYMRPNTVPFAVISEGWLSKAECKKITDALNQFEAEKHEKCGAMTREIGQHESLRYIELYSHYVNDLYWQYDLDPKSYTWMQTYSQGGNYQLHMDAGPGRMRKMTAVTFLTDEEDYEGGDLEVFFHPTSMKIPRTQGTIICFQPWILHEVHPVIQGVRQSLNMSFWGPNFR